MKLCTKVRASTWELTDGVWLLGDVDLLDVSVVPDDHVFGVDDAGILHIAGTLQIQKAP